MSLHRLTLETTPPPAGTDFVLDGDEAWHAVAVKRVHKGDTVELLDGKGTVATASVTSSTKGKRGASLDLRITALRREEPVSPRVEVWSAVPKADRASHMIDQLAQAGAALWRPLVAERSVTDADHKAERLHRIALEASKQCGRAWHMELGPPVTVSEAAAWAAANRGRATLAVTDAEGASASGIADGWVVALIGPEGGFSAQELRLLQESGASALRLGPHIMRTETAAVAAAVALLCR